MRAALLLQAAAHEVVEVADRLCALSREHGQELVHDARHDHRIVARAVVVEVRQAQAVRDLVELVVLEIRQQVLREHQRVEIHRLERDARPAAGRAHEAGIKVGIVRDDRPPARKVEKLAHGLRLIRRIGHVCIRDASQARDLGRDGHVRVDERVKLRFDLAAGEEHRADLRHAVRVQVQAGRLNVKGDELRIERQVALPVHGERAVHVVDEIALLTVDDLHAVFLRRLPHVRECLRHAVIRHGDGRVAPVGRAGHEVGGVGDGVERRVAGMQVQLHALLRRVVGANDLLALHDVARLEHHVLVVLAVVDLALNAQPHTLVDKADDALVIVRAQKSRHAHAARAVGHIKREHGRAVFGNLAAADGKHLALERDIAALERELVHGRDVCALRDGLAHEDPGLGLLLSLFLFRGGILRLDLHAAQAELRREQLLNIRALDGRGHACKPRVQLHRHALAFDEHVQHLGPVEPAAGVLQGRAVREHVKKRDLFAHSFLTFRSGSGPPAHRPAYPQGTCRGSRRGETAGRSPCRRRCRSPPRVPHRGR